MCAPFLCASLRADVLFLSDRDNCTKGTQQIVFGPENCTITTQQLTHVQSVVMIQNLPYDAYKLLAVPSPIGGVLVLCANTIHYYSQSTSCALALNEFAVAPEGSPDFPKSKITVELDTAHAAWVSHDVALLSTKTGNLLLLSLVYDGRCGGNPSYPVLFVTYVHCFFDQKQD
jgi:hypothetical protein